MSKKGSIRNSLLYHDYYSRLKMIAMSMFKWEGLPPSCNERFLEKCLFEDGMAIFVKDEEMEYLNLRCIPSGSFNVYYEPIAFTAYSINYSKLYTRDNSVYIRNNFIDKSTDSSIMIFAEKLAEIENSLRVNVNAQKTPVLVRCDEKTRTSLQAIYNQYEGNEPVIFGSKSLQEKPLEVLKTDAPFVADKLRAEKRACWNEALEFLGLNTNPADSKKERLVTNEVDANNEQTDIQAQTMLATRQIACKEINKMFGLQISVSLRTDFSDLIEPEKEEQQEEGEN